MLERGGCSIECCESLFIWEVLVEDPVHGLTILSKTTLDAESLFVFLLCGQLHLIEQSFLLQEDGQQE